MKKQFLIVMLLTVIQISFCHAQLTIKRNNTKIENIKDNRTEKTKKIFPDAFVNSIVKDLKNIPLDTSGGDALVQTDFVGSNANDFFGYTVSGAGDVNGDGFDDMIICSPNYNSNQGRAYIYFGKTTMTSTPDLIITGANLNDNFGYSASKAGDVNGDGYSDIIIGAQGFNNSTGRAYIFFGGAVMNNTPDLILSGFNTGDNFGNSVSTAGDVNGDGYSDVIVAAYYYSNLIGRAYIYYGGSSMNNVSDVILTGEAASNEFGVSVACAGDVNKDGFSDVICGADANNNKGRVYLYFGSSAMNNVADLKISGEGTFDGFGYSVSGAGDFNADGYSDFIVGASANDAGGFNAGKGYLFLGGAVVDTNSVFSFEGQPNGYLGSRVANGGDINGDGYSDAIFSSVGNNSNTGSIFIVFGGSYVIAYNVLNGSNPGDYFGTSVAGAGDLNGDGNDDIIVGAPFSNANTGRAQLYMKSASPHADPNLIAVGEATDNDFAFCVSGAGDVNGDGFQDLIVGAYDAFASRGKAYIYFGGAVMDNVADVIMKGQSYTNHFGSSVSGAGDVNNDGYSDVIVGAFGYSNDKGRAYIFYGGPAMNNVADVTMTGEADGSFFGNSVSDAGDVNNDGFDDVIVGAIYYNSGYGRVYIYYGSASMDNIADLTLSGGVPSNYFGCSVSGAGDVNNDGFSDVVVGAYGYSNFKGRAFIFYGGASMNDVPDVIMTGENDQDNFGRVLSNAGDINNDGFKDVMISSSSYGDFGNGRVYIYFGSAVMDNVADVTITGENPVSGFGNSVSDAGDVNGDGYADIIVGVNLSSGSKGSAIILYGGVLMNSVEDITVSGESAFDYFGSTVSNAGDLNGDGSADIVVGSHDCNEHTGRAYIYFSPSRNLYVNLKAFFEGSFNQNTNTQVADTIKTLLRNSSSPYSIVDSAKTVLNAGGNAALSFYHAPTGNYYIVFKHRNSIETWSKAGVSLSKGSVSYYDFTSAITQAYGSNLKTKGSNYCIYTGNVNQDGIIDAADILSVYNALGNSGYLNADVNGDNYVDVTDIIITFNNATSVISVMRP